MRGGGKAFRRYAEAPVEIRPPSVHPSRSRRYRPFTEYNTSLPFDRRWHAFKQGERVTVGGAIVGARFFENSNPFSGWCAASFRDERNMTEQVSEGVSVVEEGRIVTSRRVTSLGGVASSQGAWIVTCTWDSLQRRRVISFSAW